MIANHLNTIAKCWIVIFTLNTAACIYTLQNSKENNTVQQLTNTSEIEQKWLAAEEATKETINELSVHLLKKEISSEEYKASILHMYLTLKPILPPNRLQRLFPGVKEIEPNNENNKKED